MATLHLLGTGAAVSDPHRTTTMLAVENGTSLVVVDCGGDAWQRLLAAEVDPDSFSALIVTHEHPDHVSGFPLFMEKLWLLGRRVPVPVYGIAPALAQARRIHDAFDTASWRDKGYPDIAWHEIDHRENAPVFADEHWDIAASPGVHGVPVVGLRIVDKRGGGVLAYSCDTEVADSIRRLAENADILVHEATGAHPGHTDAVGAAQVARRAEAKRLLLVHLPPADQLDETTMQRAAEVFPNIERGIEGGYYTF